MAHASEIEKLERRYAENPKGRNFAPLADAYRKAGQLDQAIELCTSGLERHPDYVSAYIVYGRCLIDQHNDAEAGTTFRKVLDLDPENVIAFKVLAEIGTRGGRLDEAVLWLTKLLSADPMNGEAAEALAAAKGKVALAAKTATPVAPPPPAPKPPTPPAPPPVPAPAAATAKAPRPTPAPPALPPELVARAGTDMPDFIREEDPLQASDIQLQGQGQRAASGIEVYDGTIDFSGVANNQSARDDGIEIQEEIVLQAEEVHVEGLASSQYEASGLFKPDSEPVVDSEPVAGLESEDEDLGTVDLPLIMPDAEEAAPARVEWEPPAEVVPPRRTPFPPSPPPAAVTLSDDDGAADTAALSRAEPVLTETMAELFLRQGHQEEALRVYQALQALRPDDRRLQAKVAALTGGGPGNSGRSSGPVPSGQTVQAFLKGILASKPGAAAVRDSGAASPPAPAFAATPAGNPPGEPTHAAADDLSLDQVFGDDASSAPAPRPAGTPPSAASPAPSTSGTAAPGGFSFDEFFNAGGAPGSAASPAAPSSAPQASGSRARPSMEEDSDLDQFQNWLKGLKS